MEKPYRQRRRRFHTMHRILAFAALAILVAPPRAATAQTIHACYAAGSGTIYRVGEPRTPAECVSPVHVPFSWQGSGALTLPFQAEVAIDDPGPHPFLIRNTGTGQVARFELPNPSGVGAAVSASTHGSGPAIRGVGNGAGPGARFDTFGTGNAASFSTQNPANSIPTVGILSRGSGPALRAGLDPAAPSEVIAQFLNGFPPDETRVKAQIDRDGNAFFRGTLAAGTGGFGPAGQFVNANPSNGATILQVGTNGGGEALNATSTGTNKAAQFTLNSPGTSATAVGVSSNGSLAALDVLMTGSHLAGLFRVDNSANGLSALHAETNGTGIALTADHSGSSGDIALFTSDGQGRARIDKTGRGYFLNGTATGMADVAEVFEVEGDASSYAPGDVLTISTRTDRRVEHSSEPYSTRVVGVYATAPGVLLGAREVAEGVDPSVPVGVLGVLPTRVSAENGPIRRGDILVTAATAGHAMRASPVEVNGVTLYPSGAILGRALQEFEGPGTGLIEVLVSVR